MQTLTELLQECITAKGKRPLLTVRNADEFKKKYVVEGDAITYEGVEFPISEVPDQREEFVLHYSQ